MINNKTTMKKVLFTMVLLLTLSMGMQAAGQKHRHTPRKEQVDTTKNDAIEAFSDTTSADTTVKHKTKVSVTTSTSPWSSNTTTYELDDDDFGNIIHNAFSDMRGKDLAGMFFVLCVLLILFVLAPVFIIIALFYFINKNRKEKMRLAQMAMQQGQPIPDQLLKEQSPVGDEEYKSGIRQCFVGVGLMIFLWFAAGEVGFGIGALVFCIGLGKLIVAKSTASKNNFDMTHENKDNF
jgi:uncharacterized membrane protein